MGKLAQIAKSKGIRNFDQVELRQRMKSELKKMETIPPPDVHKRHYKSRGAPGHSSMDELSDQMNPVHVDQFPDDLFPNSVFNIIVKVVITTQECDASEILKKMEVKLMKDLALM